MQVTDTTPQHVGGLNVESYRMSLPSLVGASELFVYCTASCAPRNLPTFDDV